MNEMNMRNGNVRWTIHCQTFTVDNHERADGVERGAGRPAMSIREFVSLYRDEFVGRRS
jgi:hypothetical protein